MGAWGVGLMESDAALDIEAAWHRSLCETAGYDYEEFLTFFDSDRVEAEYALLKMAKKEDANIDALDFLYRYQPKGVSSMSPSDCLNEDGSPKPGAVDFRQAVLIVAKKLMAHNQAIPRRLYELVCICAIDEIRDIYPQGWNDAAARKQVLMDLLQEFASYEPSP